MNKALIFAGGTGTRMNINSIPKQFLRVNGKPIIIYTIEIFEFLSEIDQIVVVCYEPWILKLKEYLKEFNIKKVIKVVSGGKTGQSSIYNGLISLKSLNTKSTDIVLIHDGVRPLVNINTIKSCIKQTKKYGNSITITKAIETVLVKEKNNIDKILNRELCYLAKAPQCFYFESILEAHKNSIKEKLEFIDSASMMSYFNEKLYYIVGSQYNIKITTPVDYYVFKGILESQKEFKDRENE